MNEETEVLKVVTGRLDAAGIPYMVTGSMALNYYAVPRMTRDIDVVVELSASDVDRVRDLFQGDFYVELDAARDAIDHRTMFNLIHNQLIIKVDIIVRKDTDYRRTEFGRRRRVVVDAHPFFIVTAEDLMISKLDWAKDTRSEVHLADARNILASVPGLDRMYLEQWTTRLGLAALYHEVTR